MQHAVCVRCRFIRSWVQREGFELLLRKLLLLPSQPALVVVNWWAPRHDCGELLPEPPEGSLLSCAQTLWNATEDQVTYRAADCNDTTCDIQGSW
jgi:hypothetical protein